MVRGPHVLVHNGEVYNYLELAAELRGPRRGVHDRHRHRGHPRGVPGLGSRRRRPVQRDVRVRPVGRRAPPAAARPRPDGRQAAVPPADRALARVRERAERVRRRRRRWTPTTAGCRGRTSGPCMTSWPAGGPSTPTRRSSTGVTALPSAHLMLVDAGGERLDPVLGEAAARRRRPAVGARDRPAAGRGPRRGVPVDVRLRGPPPAAVGRRDRDLPVRRARLVVDRRDRRQAPRRGARPRTHEQMPRLGFHARFPGHGIDESGYAELVARQTGDRADPHLARRLAAARAASCPCCAPRGSRTPRRRSYAQHAVMAAAHDARIKVLLDGQGADELLGGYELYLGVRTAGLLLGGHPLDAARELRAEVARGPLSAELRACWTALHAALPRGAPSRPCARRPAGGSASGAPSRCPPTTAMVPAPARARDVPRVPAVARADARSGLPTLLRYEDRNSMAFGIEARVPFLDVRLIELAVRLPDRLRVDGGRDQGRPPAGDARPGAGSGAGAAGQARVRGAAARMADRRATPRSPTSSEAGRSCSAAGSRRDEVERHLVEGLRRRPGDGAPVAAVHHRGVASDAVARTRRAWRAGRPGRRPSIRTGAPWPVRAASACEPPVDRDARRGSVSGRDLAPGCAAAGDRHRRSGLHRQPPGGPARRGGRGRPGRRRPVHRRGATTSPPDVRLERLDIAVADLDALFDAWRPAVVFHLAAQANVDRRPCGTRSGISPSTSSAATGSPSPRARAGAARLVFVSSGGAVYGETRRPATEASRAAPISYYGDPQAGCRGPRDAGRPAVRHRPAVERLRAAPGARASREPSSRPSSTRRSPGAAWSSTATVARRGTSSTSWTSWTPCGGSAEPGHPLGVWNVAAGDRTTVNELADEVERAYGEPLGRDHGPRRPGDVIQSAISARPPAIARLATAGGPRPAAIADLVDGARRRGTRRRARWRPLTVATPASRAASSSCS